ncbi:MAG TPA: globin domain-containing protein [Chitinophagaceae bacterium]
MKESEIIIIKRSWKIFREIDPAIIGDVFYSKLFSYNNGLRKMFPHNMDQQYRKLMDIISTIIARLDKLDELTNEISEMARRHVKYGVRPAHYKLVGNALLWTLKQGLGKDWTLDLETAWTKCYTLLSETMISASVENPVQ